MRCAKRMRRIAHRTLVSGTHQEVVIMMMNKKVTASILCLALIAAFAAFGCSNSQQSTPGNVAASITHGPPMSASDQAAMQAATKQDEAAQAAKLAAIEAGGSNSPSLGAPKSAVPPAGAPAGGGN